MILSLMPDLNILEYNIHVSLKLESEVGGVNLLYIKYDWDTTMNQIRSMRGWYSVVSLLLMIMPVSVLRFTFILVTYNAWVVLKTL